MKVIIAGGRDFKPENKHVEWLRKVLRQLNPTEIVSGCARGADKFGEFIADKFGIDKTFFPAPWDEVAGKPGYELGYTKYGKFYWKQAGFYRNKQMAKYADACILFPGGNGTASMKQLSIKHGLIIEEYKDE